LATPVATLVGLGIAAQRGILFKQAAQLETMALTDILLLDKTGTLTLGKPQVTQSHIIDHTEIDTILSLTNLSQHPIAQGVFKFLNNQNNFQKQNIFTSYKQLPAMGIEAYKDNTRYLGGNKKLLEYFKIDISYQSDKSLFFFAKDDKVVAIFELEDQIKADALEMIQKI